MNNRILIKRNAGLKTLYRGIVMKFFLIACVLIGTLSEGCVQKPQKSAFKEQWDIKATKSEGFSPSPRERRIEYSEVVVQEEKEKDKKEVVKKLPTDRLTLRMYDTNIVTVLRAMARVAKQNIVFSSSIPGVNSGEKDKAILVNIDVDNALWDETFKGLLSANRLTYDINDSIITVMRLEDLEAQNKISAEHNKSRMEEKTKRKTEDFATAKIEINYSDLISINNTISMLCGNKATGTPEQTDTITRNASSNNTSPIQGSTQFTSAAQGPSTAQINEYGRQPGQLYCSVVPDTHSNTLIVQGPPSDLKKVIKIIDSIDKPPYQIKLKAFIVETSQATAQQLGVQWGGQLKNSNFQITPAQSATSSSTTTVGNVGSNTATTNGATNSSLNTNGSLSSNTTGSTVLGRTQNVTDATRTPPGDANFPGVDNYNSTKNTTNNTLSSNSATAAETLAASVASALLGATGASSNASTGTATSTNTSIPFFQGGSSGSGFGLNYPTLTSAATAGTGLNFLFGKIGGTILEAQLTALAGESKVTILSSPTITTMENQIASIENGKEIPYSTTSQQGTNTQYKNATLKLEITPHVVDGTSLRMKILVKDDQVDENQSNWVQGTPPLFKRETKSNLVVEDGDTIVISGLTRDKNSDTENGVPFLSNIPGLGWAFKSKGKAYEKSDVLIFITPTILGEKPIASIPPSTAKGLGTSSPNQSSGQ